MTPALAAAAVDLADVASMLLILSDACATRGDGDMQRALRGLARTVEAVEERIGELNRTEEEHPCR